MFCVRTVGCKEYTQNPKILSKSINSLTGERNSLEAGRQKNSTSGQVTTWVIRINTSCHLLALYFGQRFISFHLLILSGFNTVVSVEQEYFLTP